MGIEKEREAFEAWFLNKYQYSAEYFQITKFDADRGFYTAIDHYNPDSVNSAWVLRSSFDSWQAAKAQAVQEGFVLVKNVHPDAIVHNQGLGLFKECQIIYGWDGKSKDFKDALNKGFYHGVKLGAKAVLETTMIEAQEQTQ